MTKEEARQKCLVDPIFLGQCLGYDVQEDVHRPLFDALQTKKKKRMVLWQRGSFKTSCVVIYAVQCILNDPDIRILAMQDSLKNTKGWVKEIRSQFDGENAKSKLPALFPEFCGNKAKLHGSDLKFTVPSRRRKHLKEATVTGASTRASQTGQHYTLMLFDDLVTADNFRNVEILDKLESQFYHFLPLLDPGGDILVTGTRYSFADIYARIIEKDRGVGEWEFSIKGCYNPDGSLVFPERLTKDGRKIGFTPELLASLKRSDPVMFGPQYLNEVLMAEDQLFPQHLLQRATKSKADPEYPANAACIFTVDLAPTTNSGSDSSVIAAGKPDSRGRVWVDELRGGQWTPYQFGMVLIEMYLKHRPVRILLEKAQGAEYLKEFLDVLARDKGITLPLDFIKTQRHKDAKALRISSLEAAFKNGRLFILAGITDYEALTTELTQFPRGRHDDRPDCVALLYNSLAANITFIPTVKKLPFVFAVPYRSEAPESSACLLGDGYTC